MGARSVLGCIWVQMLLGKWVGKCLGVRQGDGEYLVFMSILCIILDTCMILLDSLHKCSR